VVLWLHRSRRRVVRVSFIAVIFQLASLRVVGAGDQAGWEEVLKAAANEGEVAVYATQSVGDLKIIWDGFRKRHPQIKLNAIELSTTSEMVTKIMAERRAGKYLADVALGAPATLYNSFYRGRVLDSFPPALILPEVLDPAKWWKGKHSYVDPEGRYVFVYQSTLYGPPIQYNTKIVNPAEIISTWDILEAKWKGKITALWPRPNYASTALLFMYHHPQIGPKFLEKLYGDMEVTFFSDLRQGTDWLASGKYPLCFLCRLRRAMEQGLPVTEINPYHLKEGPGIGAGNGAIGVMNSQPHPNAAKVFVNWYLSREGQIAFRLANNTIEDEVTTSLREDLPLEVVPRMARRGRDVDYIEISRPDWMDWKPVEALLKKAREKKQ